MIVFTRQTKALGPRDPNSQLKDSEHLGVNGIHLSGERHRGIQGWLTALPCPEHGAVPSGPGMHVAIKAFSSIPKDRESLEGREVGKERI